MSDVEDISRYWCVLIASFIEADNSIAVDPTISVIGHEADAIATSDEYGDNEMDNMAWLTGYLTYPCDAEYITATTTVMALHESMAPNGVDENTKGHPETRLAVVSWTHSITTRETGMFMLVQHVGDDGEMDWERGGISDGFQHDLFGPVIEAAHSYDRLNSMPDEVVARRVALDFVEKDSGTGYEALLLPTGTLRKAMADAE